jgi:hypothetical protein
MHTSHARFSLMNKTLYNEHIRFPCLGPHIRQVRPFMNTIWVSLSLRLYLDENENTVIVKARGKFPRYDLWESEGTSARNLNFDIASPLSSWGKSLRFPVVARQTVEKRKILHAENKTPISGRSARSKFTVSTELNIINISQEYLLNQPTLQITYAYIKNCIKSLSEDWQLGFDSWHRHSNTFSHLHAKRDSGATYHLMQLRIGEDYSATEASSATEVKREWCYISTLPYAFTT